MLLPPTAERISTEMDTNLSLGLCCIALHGYSADVTRKSFERASELSAQVGEPRKEIQAIFGQWGHFWMRAQHARAIELSETLLAKAELLHDDMVRVVAHRCLGSTLFTLGRFEPARAHLERALTIRPQEIAEGSLFSIYAVEPSIAARLMLAWDLWILGYPDQARATALEALGHAEDRSHPYALAFAHYVTSAVCLLRGEFEQSLDYATRSLAISNEHRINLYALYSRFGRGCALAKLGQKEHGLVDIRAAIDQADRSNLRYMRGFMLCWLATVQSEVGDSESALSTVDDALKPVDDGSGHSWEAELRTLRGDILIAGRFDAIHEVERSYHDAIAVSQNQGARSLELRATCSLARLLRSRGRHDEACARLAPILGWFTEGQERHEAANVVGEVLQADFGARPHDADRAHDPAAHEFCCAPNTCSMRARIVLLARFARICASDSGWLRLARR